MLDDPASAAASVGAPTPTLAASERELILRALGSSALALKGPAGAAAALGLNPSTLYSRMKKLGIRPPGPAGDAGAARRDGAPTADHPGSRSPAG